VVVRQRVSVTTVVLVAEVVAAGLSDAD